MKKLDQRVLYVGLVVVAVIPYFFALGLPLPIAPETQKFYNYIDTLRPGDVVCLSYELTASSYPEAGRASLPVIQHLFNKPGIKILVWSYFDPEGPIIFQTRVLPVINMGAKQYGVDWVFLGYIAGLATGVSAVARDIQKAFPLDYYGTPIETLPIMNNIHSATDFTVIVTPTIGGPGDLIQQIQVPFGTRIVIITGELQRNLNWPYIQSGQVSQYLVGLSGAAQYEQLIGVKLGASVPVDVLSLGALYAAGLVILGNIYYLYSKRKHTSTVTKEVIK